jgi:hypothetical protein
MMKTMVWRTATVTARGACTEASRPARDRSAPSELDKILRSRNA